MGLRYAESVLKDLTFVTFVSFVVIRLHEEISRSISANRLLM
jgi:hypothetical protein